MSSEPADRAPQDRPGAVEVAVIGASFSGLLAAAAAAGAGVRVTVLERDPLDPQMTTTRSGVPQGSQPHILLRRGLEAIETLLPGARDELLAAGGVPLDGGELAWHSADGWLPRVRLGHGFVSLSRPLLEAVVRRRVLALDGVRLRSGWPVGGLGHDGRRWRLTGPDGASVTADVLIDASGRSSRLPHWLTELGLSCPEPEVVEAKLGYATRRYRTRADAPPPVGIVVASTTDVAAGALGLPVENGEWLICAAGYGDRRPRRDPADFERHLRELPDPALADLAARLEPIDEVRIHRQTANRRQPYGRTPDWPAGLLVVGDALTAFNPVYGQGITVGACQAELLRSRLGRELSGSRGRRRLDRPTTVRLQRDLAAVADFPWSVATGEDVHYPSCNRRPTLAQEAVHRWTIRINQLAAGGDPYCRSTMSGVYQMVTPPGVLFGPKMVGRVLRSVLRGVPAPAPRPAVLAPAGSGRRPVSSPPAP